MMAIDAKTFVPPFSAQHLEAISRVLADTDKLDILTMISFVHRKLDRATLCTFASGGA